MRQEAIINHLARLSHSNKLSIILLSIVVVAIQITKIWGHWDSLWLDEIFSISIAISRDISTLFTNSLIEGIPLGFHLWNFSWWNIGQLNLLKSISIISSVAFVFCGFNFFHRAFNLSAGVIFAAILLEQNFFAIHAGEIRPYSYLLLLSILSLSTLSQLFDNEQAKRSMFAYILISFIGISFHYLYSLVVLIQLLTFATLKERNKLFPIVIGFIILLLALPIYYRLFLLLSSGENLWTFIPRPTGNIFSDYWSVAKVLFQSQRSHFVVLLVILSYGLSIAFYFKKSSRFSKKQKFIIVQLLVGSLLLPLILYGISIVSQSLLIPRYYTYTFVSVLGVIAAISGQFIGRKLSIVGILILLSLEIIFHFPIHPHYEFRNSVHTALQKLRNIQSPCYLVTSPNNTNFADAIATLTNHDRYFVGNTFQTPQEIQEHCSASENIVLLRFLPHSKQTLEMKEDLNTRYSFIDTFNAKDFYFEYWKMKTN